MMLSKPGETIRECLEQENAFASFEQLCKENGYKSQDFIDGTQEIHEKEALFLSRVFLVDIQFWLNRELAYRSKLSIINEFSNLLDGHIKELSTKNHYIPDAIIATLKTIKEEINAE